jgi:hypothetical protein
LGNLESDWQVEVSIGLLFITALGRKAAESLRA